MSPTQRRQRASGDLANLGNSSVNPEQRFTAANPCPICDGHKDLLSGVGERCFGFLSSDGRSAICTRDESDRPAGDSGGWVHSLAERPSEAAQTTRTGLGQVEATYTYEAEDGTPLFEVVRFEGKQFRQRRAGSSSWDVSGVRLVPYHLPQVAAAVAGGCTVYVVEGEKDVHAVEAAGGIATCNPGGAKKWRDEYSEHLRSARVVVVRDRDDGPGAEHARIVRRSLLCVAAHVEIVEAAAGKDAHDHLAAGHALGGFAPVPPRFESLHLASYKPEPPEWLYEPLLLAKAYTLVTAGAGVGKTMVALCAMRHVVASGRRVVYLDQENGPDVLVPRARAIGYTDAELDLVSYFPYPSAAASELAELVAEVAAIEPALVIFDAKANFLATAGLDEDSSMDNTAWHGQIVQQLQAAGAAVLDLDHSGHRVEGRPRGSSAKEAVAEASWSLSTDRQFDPDNTATATFTRGLKNRRGALPQEARYKIGGDGHGGFAFDLLTEPDAVDDGRVARRRRIKEDIAKRVCEHWDAHGEALSMSAIGKSVTGQRTEVSELAKDLGNTPGSGFWLITGPRGAVLLRPTIDAQKKAV